MPFRVNLGQYVTPFATPSGVDITEGIRSLAEHKRQMQKLAENQRQFTSEQERLKGVQADTVRHQDRVASDINSRFAVQQGQELDKARYEEAKAKHAKVSNMANAARELVAQGKWNEAYSMMGALKDAGANVNFQQGPDGKPIFDIQVPEYSGPGITGDTDSILSTINGGRNPFQPGSVNTLEPIAKARQESSGSLSSPAPKEPGQQPPITTDHFSQGEMYDPETKSQISNIERQLNPVTKAPSDFNPHQIDTGVLSNMTEMRLNPVLSGIEGALPKRFQGHGNSLLQGYKELGMPPQQTLELLQKPLDTAAGLWRGQMGAEAAMARAYMSEGNQDSNRGIRLEDRTWRRLQDVNKNGQLDIMSQKVKEADEIDQLLNSGNPMADSQVLHKIRNMFQSGVATQQDIDAVQYGIKPFLQQLKDAVDERVLGTGLNPDSRAGLRRFVQQMAGQDRVRIRGAREQMKTLLNNVETKEEAVTALNYMSAMIPESEWDDTLREWNNKNKPKAENKPSVGSGSGSKKSVSVSAGSRGMGDDATQMMQDADDEAERLLNAD